MSGIAGILRRDGRPISEKWVSLLENTLNIRSSGMTWRFEDSADIDTGTLELILLQKGVGPVPGPMVADGDMETECVAAIWNKETLELKLIRRGIGQKPLYLLDLGDAGDGVVFCSNPLPLIQISREVELKEANLLSAVQQYLQLGFVTGEHSLLHNVQSVQLQSTNQIVEHTHPLQSTGTTQSPAEDLIALVDQLGQPFADASLLSRLWLYRSAKEQSNTIIDGLIIQSERLRRTQSLARWHQLLSHVPKQTQARDWSKFGITSIDAVCDVSLIQQLTEHELLHPYRPEYSGSMEEQLKQYDKAVRVPDSIIRGMDGAAAEASIELQINPTENQLEVTPFPLASWLRSPQSSIGQLAGDILTSQNAFDGIPICNDEVTLLFDSHRNKSNDYSNQLFTLLTLALWNQRVRA